MRSFVDFIHCCRPCSTLVIMISRLMLTRRHHEWMSMYPTFFEPIARQLRSLPSLFCTIYFHQSEISPMGWRVIVVLFLLMEMLPQEQISSDELCRITLIGISLNRGNCSIIEDKADKRDVIIMEGERGNEEKERKVGILNFCKSSDFMLLYQIDLACLVKMRKTRLCYSCKFALIIVSFCTRNAVPSVIQFQ